MKQTILGHSRLRASRICLGCMGFGDAEKGMHKWTLNEDASSEIIAYALERGINFFDTAMGYQGGTSEEYLGSAIRKLAKREDVVIATKFIPRSNPEISGRQHVENCLNASLKRLGMDYIDLYILHMWDYHTPVEEIMDGLNRAVKEGKVRAIGVSNCFPEQLEKANAVAEENGWAKFTSVQGHHNLIFREEEREMIPLCRKQNIALTPYSALASGRLSRLPGEITKRLDTDAYAKGKYDATEEQDGTIIRRVHEIAQERGTGMTQIALAWLLTKVNAPVVGATKKSHIDGAAEAVDIELSAGEIARLEELYRPHPLVGVMAENH